MNNKMRFLKWLGLGLVCGVSIVGCSGGGSGDDNNDNDDGQTQNPPSERRDSPGLEAVALPATEFVTVYGRITADAVLAAQQSPQNTRIYNCQNGGTRNLTYIDYDTSGDLSLGDTVTIDYQNCRDPIVDGTENGRIELTILDSGTSEDSDTDGIGGQTFSSDVVFDNYRVSDISDDLTVRGGFRLSFLSNGTPGEQVHRLRESLTPGIEIGLDGGDITIRGGSFSQRYDYRDASYAIAFDSRATANVGGESVSFMFNTLGSTPRNTGAIRGQFGMNPTSGIVRINSPEIDARECVFIDESDDSNTATRNAPLIRVPDSNDTTCSGDEPIARPATQRWSDLVDGAIFRDIDFFRLRAG